MEETNAGRKGRIRARAALSPDSLHFLLFNLVGGGGEDSCITNALIMIIFCAQLIHVKPSLCQIEKWHFYFMNIAPSVTFIVHSQSCNSECQVNYQAFAFLPLYLLSESSGLSLLIGMQSQVALREPEASCLLYILLWSLENYHAPALLPFFSTLLTPEPTTAAPVCPSSSLYFLFLQSTRHQLDHGTFIYFVACLSLSLGIWAFWGQEALSYPLLYCQHLG